jgi:ubiquinone/menaquinone biosynthesis C-methylase UbiE
VTTSIPHSGTHLPKSDPLLPAEGYRLWAQTYDVDPNPLLALEMRTLIGMLKHIKNKVFLDIACGTARWAECATTEGARAFGADLVPEMLAIARNKPRIAGHLVQADAQSLPFTGECADLAICSFALGYIKDPEFLIEELSRVTKRGGTVIVSDLHPQALAAGWRRTFRCGSALFEIESHAYSQDRLVHAGRYANLELREVFQPYFGKLECTIMQNAGKAELIDKALSVPAILILAWERT